MENWKRNWYWGLGFGLVADARAQLKKSQTRSVIASAREITLIRIWILLQRRSSKSVTRSSSALWCPKVANNTRTHTHTQAYGMWLVAIRNVVCDRSRLSLPADQNQRWRFDIWVCLKNMIDLLCAEAMATLMHWRPTRRQTTCLTTTWPSGVDPAGCLAHRLAGWLTALAPSGPQNMRDIDFRQVMRQLINHFLVVCAQKCIGWGIMLLPS